MKSLYDMFLASVERRPQHPALRAKRNSTTYNVSLTYREVADQAEAVAAALVQLGVAAGDRTAIASTNRPEWAVMDLGSLGAAAADVPLYPTLTGPQMAYILNDSGARVLALENEAMLQKILAVEDELLTVEHVICFDVATSRPRRMRLWSWDEFLQHGRDSRAASQPEVARRRAATATSDLASIIYTSGTTGQPKGAMLTHANLLSNTLASLKLVDMRDDDVGLSFLPLSHILERSIYYIMLMSGCTIAYAESTETIADNMQEIHPTWVACVPRLFEKIHARILEGVQQQPPLRRRIFYAALALGQRYQTIKAQGRPPSPWLEFQYKLASKVAFKRIHARTGGRIRYFLSGGAPLRKDLGEFFLAAGLSILEGYGLTETSPLISCTRPGEPRFGTVGRPVDGVECRIADDGEIVCRGPNVMQGYFNKPDETRDAIDGEGWFHTGDIGVFDADGFLVITDRKKELLVLSNGKKVAPQPIENALKASPFIEQVMLLGDNRQYVGALVVPSVAAVQPSAPGVPPAQWDDHEGMRKLIAAEIDKVNLSLAQFEKVKQFALVDREFTQERDELTPTLKLKRKVVLENFQPLVDKVYSRQANEVHTVGTK